MTTKELDDSLERDTTMCGAPCFCVNIDAAKEMKKLDKSVWTRIGRMERITLRCHLEPVERSHGYLCSSSLSSRPKWRNLMGIVGSWSGGEREREMICGRQASQSRTCKEYVFKL